MTKSLEPNFTQDYGTSLGQQINGDSMTDERAPTCLYCGHTMLLVKRKNGYKVVNEGMDGPVHWAQRMTYRYYARCHHCNARGPLSQTYNDAINACRRSK